MRYVYRATAALFVMCTLMLAAGPAVAAPPQRLHLRTIVTETSKDLLLARQTSIGPADTKRLVDAQHRLSVFAATVFRVPGSRYIPAQLKGVIKALQSILATNTLLANDRSRLTADLGGLQDYYNAHH